MAKHPVQVERLGKKFGLSLRSALKYGLTDSLRRLSGRGKDETLRPGEFWALKDVDFTLEPGDALGIMGLNGSGKTTLLRILNGTYTPDEGKATLRGRVGALIAAGAGFSPMLSGRENVYISGALLGMTPAEIRKRFDEIVAFAELDEFIDMPVRNYSSGMGVRLGFAVAVLGSPDVLLVDEVLAVGDLNFQKKCFERIDTLKREGTTILLVSHSPGAIWAVCNKGLTLHHGITQGIVPVEDACREYDHRNFQDRLRNSPGQSEESLALPKEYGGLSGGTGDIFITKVQLFDTHGHEVTALGYGQSFTLRLHLRVMNPLSKVIFRVQVDSEIVKAIAIIDSYEAHGVFYDLAAGESFVDIAINAPNLRPGVYSFCPSISQHGVGVHLFYRYNFCSLQVSHPQEQFLYADFRSFMHLTSTFSMHSAGGSTIANTSDDRSF
ncbi:ABC transporter ATP-binding protein [Megalodesulfovibrio paquesii]